MSGAETVGPHRSSMIAGPRRLDQRDVRDGKPPDDPDAAIDG